MAYFAMCLTVKDQHDDIREWIDYHKSLGAGKFYVFDNNSSTPMMGVMLDYIEAGLVDYHFLTHFRHHSNRPQLYVYDTCIARYRRRHHWMAFTDADEFIVLRDPTARDLPTFMQGFEAYGGLVVHWQMLGASGRTERPEGGTLASYSACFNWDDPEHTHIKTIANLRYTLHVGPDPHHFVFWLDKYAVNSALEQVEGPRAHRVVADRIVLYHYVTKSRADYTAKMGRGSAMGNHKSIEFFDAIQERANANCSELLQYGR